MRRKWLLLTLSSLFVMLGAASRAEACSCAGPGALCEAFGGAAAVFVGTVTDITRRPRKTPAPGDEPDWAPRTVRFSVSEAFSGVEGAQVEVSTGLGGGDCGYNFVKGSTYLVYAYGRTGGGLGTGICTRTTLAFGAEEDLEYLRGLSRQPRGVTLSGRVERAGVEAAGSGTRTSIPLGGLRVSAAGADGVVAAETMTDAQGRYRLTGLSPGTYKLSLRLPDELTTYQPAREVRVADRGCASEDFLVTDNGRIAGRVLDAEGKPAARLSVAVVDAEGKNPEFKYGRHAQTDEQGRYRFEGLPPGRYLLGVHLAGFPQPDDPTNAYARTYYPGVARAEEAEALELKAGEELKGRDLRLPPRRAESVINGRVVWDDGTPVANARVSYKDLTYGDAGINYGAQADERGQFTLKTYAGSVYRITVASGRPSEGDPQKAGPTEESPALIISVGAPVETVSIVIKKLR